MDGALEEEELVAQVLRGPGGLGSPGGLPGGGAAAGAGATRVHGARVYTSIYTRGTGSPGPARAGGLGSWEERMHASGERAGRPWLGGALQNLALAFKNAVETLVLGTSAPTLNCPDDSVPLQKQDIDTIWRGPYSTKGFWKGLFQMI